MDCVNVDGDQGRRLLARVMRMKGDTGRPTTGWVRGWVSSPWDTPPRVDPDQIVTVFAYARWRQGIVTKVTRSRVHVVYVTTSAPDVLKHVIVNRYAPDGRSIYLPD